MKAVTHERRGSHIIELASNHDTNHKTVSAAKRASRVLQKAGAVLRVVETHKPVTARKTGKVLNPFRQRRA